MRDFHASSPYGLAYQTYRIWGDYWSLDNPTFSRTPPLYHWGNTPHDGALIIAPCASNEVEAFITTEQHRESLHFKIETDELGTSWIGFWTLFSVHLERSS